MHFDYPVAWGEANSLLPCLGKLLGDAVRSTSVPAGPRGCGGWVVGFFEIPQALEGHPSSSAAVFALAAAFPFSGFFS